jgi:hypothetical protein
LDVRSPRWTPHGERAPELAREPRQLSPSAQDFNQFLKANIADSAAPWTLGFERAA